MSRIKVIQIPVDKDTYRALKKQKGKKTWQDFLIDISVRDP